MPELKVALSEHVTQDPELLAVQDDIIFARSEDASWEKHNNEHEYLGLVERLFYVRKELQRIVKEQRRLYPEASFILEYHQSCMLPREFGALVMTFCLQTKREIGGQESRLNSYISLRLEKKTDYRVENTAISTFMKTNDIKRFDDGSGQRSEIKYEEF